MNKQPNQKRPDKKQEQSQKQSEPIAAPPENAIEKATTADNETQETDKTANKRTEQEQPYRPPRNIRNHLRWKDWRENLAIVISLMALFIVGGQSLIYYEQLRIGKRQNEIANSQAEIANRQLEEMRASSFTTNRAHLSINKIELRLAEREKIEFVMVFGNDGNTPAHMLHSGSVELLSPRNQIPRWDDCTNPAFPPIEALIVPPQNGKTQIFRFRLATNSDIEDVRTGRVIFGICGNRPYETLGTTQPFRFCSYWDSKSKMWIECQRGP